MRSTMTFHAVVLALILPWTLQAQNLVEVSILVESKCPDATDWEDRFFPYVKGLSSIMNLTIDFIAKVEIGRAHV